MINLFEIIKPYGEVDKTYAIDLAKERCYDKISIQNDLMFKAMFQNTNRIKYPKLLLNLLFSKNNKLNFDNLQFYKNETDKRRVLDKGERCDFIATLGNVAFNIEMNNCSDIGTIERNIEYAFRIYSGKIQKGRKYYYTPTIQININNFAFKGNNNTVDVSYIQNKDGYALTDKLIFIMIYVPNIIKKCYNDGIESLTDFERFILVLALENNEECFEIAKGDSIMEEYINEATNVTFDTFFGESYDKAEADIKEAIKDSTIEIAKKMLLEDADINFISRVTELSIDKINRLKEELASHH